MNFNQKGKKTIMTEKKCLSNKDIENYVRGSLFSEEQDLIEVHMAKCSLCFRQVIFTLKGGTGKVKEEGKKPAPEEKDSGKNENPKK